MLQLPPTPHEALVPPAFCNNKLQIERKLAFVTGLVPVKALTQSIKTVVLSKIPDRSFVLYLSMKHSFSSPCPMLEMGQKLYLSLKLIFGLNGTRHN